MQNQRTRGKNRINVGGGVSDGRRAAKKKVLCQDFSSRLPRLIQSLPISLSDGLLSEAQSAH